jgi:hypothetical protein
MEVSEDSLMDYVLRQKQIGESSVSSRSVDERNDVETKAEIVSCVILGVIIYTAGVLSVGQGVV